MKTLRSCPWCGWPSAEIRMHIDSERRPHRTFYIFCRHCGTMSARSRFRWMARRLWNKRVVTNPKTRREKRGG